MSGSCQLGNITGSPATNEKGVLTGCGGCSSIVAESKQCEVRNCNVKIDLRETSKGSGADYVFSQGSQPISDRGRYPAAVSASPSEVKCRSCLAMRDNFDKLVLFIRTSYPTSIKHFKIPIQSNVCHTDQVSS